MIKIQQIHHVAYRCNNAKETVKFYKDYLNMELLVSISEDRVPSTKEPNPYMHVFLDAGQGNILAFFEITGEKDMDRDQLYRIGGFKLLRFYETDLKEENWQKLYDFLKK